MWNLLIVNEEPKPVDVIIVLSGGEDRVEHGVRLYQQGYANKILFTGGGSQKMKEQAMSLGIKEDQILLEGKSRTTFENAKYSIEIIRAQGFQSAIIVTSPTHTRRANIIFSQFFKGVDLTICSVPYDLSIADKWWKDRNTAEVVITEYLKLIWHYLFER